MNEDEHKNACRYYWTAGWWSGAAIAGSAVTMLWGIGLFIWWAI